jgi:hypothetical protein
MKTMKSKSLLLMALLAFTGIISYSQENNSKQTKEEQKLAVQQQTEALLNAREFVFIGLDAYPTGYRTVSLTGRQNFVKFHPELIESDMPYFGRGNGSAAYGSSSDAGLKFTGKPEEYAFSKKKKNYQITATVKEPGDSYDITLIVQFSGSATLTIISSSRSPISYNGYITPPVASGEKK